MDKLTRNLSMARVLPSALILLILGRYIGPTLYKFLRIWYYVSQLPGEINLSRLTKYKSTKLYKGIQEIHEKHNKKVVKILPNSISVYDPKIIRELLIVKDIPKASLYQSFRFDFLPDHIFATTNPEFHKDTRKVLSPAFGIAYLKSQEGYILKAVENLINKWDHIIASKSFGEAGQVDVWMDMHRVGTEVIGEIAFGTSFGTLQINGEPSPLAENIEKGFRMGASLTFFPQFIRKRPRLASVFPIIREAHKISLDFIKMMKPLIEARRNGPPRKDILQCLIDGQWKDGSNLSDLDITVGALISMFAGSDTSSNTMAFTIIHLLKNPNVYKRLVEEVLSVPLPTGQKLFTSSDVKNNMPYLEACIKETMRITPVAVALVRQAGEDMVLNGSEGTYFVAEGTWIFLLTASLHMDPDIWKDPAAYKPERFLESDLGNDISRLANISENYMPFSHGSRNCIGQNLAWAEMRVVLANILKNYELSEVDPSQSTAMGFQITLQLDTGSYVVGIKKRTV